jgi:hypothetical protein
MGGGGRGIFQLPVLLFDRIEDFTPPEIAVIIATQLPGSALRVPIRVRETNG